MRLDAAPTTPVRALLDVGSSKIACALVDADGVVLARSFVASAGVRAGLILEPSLAHGAIAKAIVAAEDAARTHAVAAIVAVNGGAVASRHLTADVGLDPPIVTSDVVDRLYHGLLSHATAAGRSIVHANPVRFRLDGRAFAAAPLERFGRTLDMAWDLVTADTSAVQRLVDAVEDTGLSVERLVPGGLAAAEAVTTEAERAEAIAVVDIGHALTTITTFNRGRCGLATTIALGAGHVEAELASRLYGAPKNQGRITTERAISLIAHADASQIMGFIGSERPSQVTTESSAVIPPSAGITANDITALERLLRLVADRLDLPAAGLTASSPVVLTGGGSRLTGLSATAEWLWARRVKLGQVADRALSAPEWAVTAGLVSAVGRRLGVAHARRGGSERRVA